MSLQAPNRRLIAEKHFNVATMQWQIIIGISNDIQMRRSISLPEMDLNNALVSADLGDWLGSVPSSGFAHPAEYDAQRAADAAVALFACHLKLVDGNRNLTALYSNTVRSMEKTLRACGETVAACDAAMKAAGLDGPVAGMVTTF